MAQHTEPTDDQLRAAWREIAQPGWGSFEEAMHAARRFALARATAQRRLGGTRPAAPAQSTPASEPATTPTNATQSFKSWPARRTSTATPQPLGLDRKRLASGERDDD